MTVHAPHGPTPPGSFCTHCDPPTFVIIPAAAENITSLLSKVEASFRGSPSDLLFALRRLKMFALQVLVMALESQHEAHKAIGRKTFYHGNFQSKSQPRRRPPCQPW